MPANSSLVRQVAGRFLIAFLLSTALSTLVGAWVYYAANQQAAEAQQARARNHYTNVMPTLSDAGERSLQYQIRIEAQRFLEDPKQRKEKLLAYLTAQGGSIEFPSLRIEDPKASSSSFRVADDKIPRRNSCRGQESPGRSTQSMAPVLVFPSTHLLGNENGYLLLFKPMDHALRLSTAIAPPHQPVVEGKTLASSRARMD